MSETELKTVAWLTASQSFPGAKAGQLKRFAAQILALLKTKIKTEDKWTVQDILDREA